MKTNIIMIIKSFIKLNVISNLNVREFNLKIHYKKLLELKKNIYKEKL